MNLLDEVKLLLKQNNLLPQKKLGQNFCIDQEVLNNMVRAAELKPTEKILEIGPGFGFLTRELLAAGCEVVAIEKDPPLFKTLKKMTAVWPKLSIYNFDALQLSASFLEKMGSYSIVANLPYSISSRFFKKYLNSTAWPQSITVLVQKEVAERIVAVAGEMSVLSVSVQTFCQARIISQVKPESFWPQPEVESAILRLDNNHPYLHEKDVPEKIFWQVVKCGFSSRRKQLQNNLVSGLHLSKNKAQELLSKAGLDLMTRPQDLTVPEWLKLANLYNLEK